MHGVDVEQPVVTSAARVARDHCLAPERVDASIGEGGRYRRMFELPALEVDETLLLALGAAGGFCDGGELATNARVEAGWPFFGQYVAHDLTADRSPLRAHADIAALRNMRSPRMNLESLYGGGPIGSPYLFGREDPAKLLLDGRDLPRNHEGTALVGDPRNDVHVFMSQMQVAFIGAHNLIVDRLREDGVAEADVFEEARRALVWHYQWLIVNEFLPGLVGEALIDELTANGPRFYRPDPEPYIPLEFADAAFRYGHSQIRDRYQLQQGGARYALFPDLIGFGPVGDRVVDWSRLFDVSGSAAAQRAKPIDGTLPQSLIRLPQAITGRVSEAAERSLAARDLERGQATQLPSGEAVARLIGADTVTQDAIGLHAYGWEGETPLWLYVLREASANQSGDRLGEVGGRIVAEVLFGVIAADPESFLTLEPTWQPTLPARDGGLKLADLLVPNL